MHRSTCPFNYARLCNYRATLDAGRAISFGVARGLPSGRRQPARYFTITHPFHPWRGRRFELLEQRPQWGQWRVYYLTKSGRPAFFPAGWTDLGPVDPFVEQARGRAIARMEDLVELAELVSADVKEIKPQL